MMKTGGYEWVVDAYGCVAQRLRDLPRITNLMEHIIQRLNLQVAQAPVVYPFPGEAGVTALYLLTESHLTIHTYPEMRFAAINLYCCRAREAYPWEQELGRVLGSQRVVLHGMSRGDMRMLGAGG